MMVFLCQSHHWMVLVVVECGDSDGRVSGKESREDVAKIIEIDLKIMNRL